MRIPREAVIKDNARLADQRVLIMTEDTGDPESENILLSNGDAVELTKPEETTKLAS